MSTFAAGDKLRPGLSRQQMTPRLPPLLHTPPSEFWMSVASGSASSARAADCEDRRRHCVDKSAAPWPFSCQRFREADTPPWKPIAERLGLPSFPATGTHSDAAVLLAISRDIAPTTVEDPAQLMSMTRRQAAIGKALPGPVTGDTPAQPAVDATAGHGSVSPASSTAEGSATSTDTVATAPYLASPPRAVLAAVHQETWPAFLVTRLATALPCRSAASDHGPATHGICLQS